MGVQGRSGKARLAKSPKPITTTEEELTGVGEQGGDPVLDGPVTPQRATTPPNTSPRIEKPMTQ